MTVGDTREAMSESRAAAIFGKVLKDAAAAVDGLYFRHPYETHTQGPGSEHYERVYCGELYHHIRHLLDISEDPEVVAALDAGYRVSLELPKESSYIRVDRDPDLLWHVPGQRTNGVVVEVKPSRAAFGRMKKDVAKLVLLKGEPALYSLGVLLVFGDPMTTAKKRKLRGLKDEADVVVLVHEAPGERPTGL